MRLILAKDPSWTLAVGPVLAWSSEVWRALTVNDGRCLAMPELRRMWWQAQPNACTAWRKVKGPLVAAAMSLRRIGWYWLDPFTFIDDLGTKLNVTMCSPAYIGMVLQEGCLRTLERKAMQKHQDTIPLDEHFEHHAHQGRKGML